ncbi:MAG TPA: LysM peptidoglycan-binding domain-containing protein [Dehalococcoidia bacterium]|nr:LysM peptidoglycan-binding domain-containing protein [Dehalococcoidia bacterium]
MDCYSCDQAAVNACKRCGKPYCEDHGNAQYCADCLRPASALPSFNLYRGSLLVMLIGTALAVMLLVRPPGETKGAQPVIVARTTPTPTTSGAPPTVAAATPQATGTPSGSETPGTETVTAAAGTPTVAATASPFDEYIVQEGDNLFSIAQAQLPPGDDLTAYVNAIATLNNLGDPETAVLSIGQKLLLPKHNP